MTAVYRVRWRRPSWKPGRMNARLYSQRGAAEQLAARLQADQRYDDVQLHRREVVAEWSPITARTPQRQRWTGTTPPKSVDAAVNVW